MTWQPFIPPTHVVEALAAEPPTSRQLVAFIAELEPLRVREHVLGPELAAVNGMPGWPHAVGDRVLCSITAGIVTITHNLEGRPMFGVVAAAASGGTVPVTVPGRSTPLPMVFTGTAPASGTRVIVGWGSDGPYVVGPTGTASAPIPPQPTPAPAPDSAPYGVVSAFCTEAATARSGAWRTDGDAARRPYQGYYAGGNANPNTGFMFYGDQFAGPAGRTAHKAVLTFYRATGVGAAAPRPLHLAAHEAAAKPATPPPLKAGFVADIPGLATGQRGELEIPIAFGQGLLDGTIRGLALSYAGTTDYLAGLAPSDRLADALKLDIYY